MSGICTVTHKRPVAGRRISHSNRKSPRRFLVNIHYKRFWSEERNQFVRLKVSCKGMRIINRLGVDVFLDKE